MQTISTNSSAAVMTPSCFIERPVREVQRVLKACHISCSRPMMIPLCWAVLLLAGGRTAAGLVGVLLGTLSAACTVKMDS